MQRLNTATKSPKRLLFGLAALIALLTLIVYLPALRDSFVYWDDQIYVLDNVNIRTLDPAFLRWAVTATVAANWHPLTVFTYALDWAIWGKDPFGYHLVNIVLHAINTYLAFVLSWRLAAIKLKDDHAGAALFSATTALLFGLHPLHVESVAWISERKDVLFTLFYFLSLLFYLEYAGKKAASAYLACLVFFALSIMSKPMAISLPAVLLILDFYPLERTRLEAKKIIIEKLPFFALSAACAVITMSSQTKALVANGSVTLSIKLQNAVHALAFYLYKMVLPTGLAPYYPLFTDGTFASKLIPSAALIIFATLVSIAAFRKNRLFAAALAFYVITLLPVLGIIQVGGQAAADRYTYLPGMGPFMLAGAGAHLFVKRYRRAMPAVIALIAACSVLLAVLTVRQIAVWKDTVSLWTREIETYPIVMGYMYRASAYDALGRYEDSVKDYTVVIESRGKDLLDIYINRGAAYQNLGDFESALRDYTAALVLDPQNIKALNNRGNSYKSLRRYGLATADFEKALGLAPSNPVVLFNLGTTCVEAGDTERGYSLIKAASGMGLKAADEYLKGAQAR